jgi:hypothetical protein
MHEPRNPLEVPCPYEGCGSPIGEKCTRFASQQSNVRVTQERPHESRMHRFERAVRDWWRMQEWKAGEPLR